MLLDINSKTFQWVNKIFIILVTYIKLEKAAKHMITVYYNDLSWENLVKTGNLHLALDCLVKV